MNKRFSACKRGFTLVELVVAMAITSILVLIIVGLTNQGLDVWKSISEDISTSSRSRIALQTICQDFESMQWQRGNRFQWFYSGSEKASKLAGSPNDGDENGPNGLRIPNASRLIFFTSARDRDPSVASSEELRGNYRTARAHNLDSQGDVNAVGYKLIYRDQILDLSGGRDARSFPLYSLYRQLVSPRDAFDYLIGQDDLEKAYSRFAHHDDKFFLVDNIIEMTLTLEVEYKDGGSKENDRPKVIQIPVISVGSGRHSSNGLELFGDRLVARGGSVGNLEKGRIVAANVSITVVTEDGMNFANLVRLGKRRPPRNLQDFFAKYTRTFAREVMIPQAL